MSREKEADEKYQKRTFISTKRTYDHDRETEASYSISESKMKTILGKVKPSQVQSIYRSPSYFVNAKALETFLFNNLLVVPVCSFPLAKG